MTVDMSESMRQHYYIGSPSITPLNTGRLTGGRTGGGYEAAPHLLSPRRSLRTDASVNKVSIKQLQEYSLPPPYSLEDHTQHSRQAFENDRRNRSQYSSEASENDRRNRPPYACEDSDRRKRRQKTNEDTESNTSRNSPPVSARKWGALHDQLSGAVCFPRTPPEQVAHTIEVEVPERASRRISGRVSDASDGVLPRVEFARKTSDNSGGAMRKVSDASDYEFPSSRPILSRLDMPVPIEALIPCPAPVSRDGCFSNQESLRSSSDSEYISPSFALSRDVSIHEDLLSHCGDPGQSLLLSLITPRAGSPCKQRRGLLTSPLRARSYSTPRITYPSCLMPSRELTKVVCERSTSTSLLPTAASPHTVEASTSMIEETITCEPEEEWNAMLCPRLVAVLTGNGKSNGEGILKRLEEEIRLRAYASWRQTGDPSSAKNWRAAEISTIKPVQRKVAKVAVKTDVPKKEDEATLIHIKELERRVLEQERLLLKQERRIAELEELITPRPAA